MEAEKGGFTLIELMLAMAIVSILTAVAVPMYSDYVKKSNNNKAIADLNMIQLCIERFYSIGFTYPNTLADIAPCLPNKGLDPWAHSYQYLNIIDGGPGIKGQVRKDKKLNPINTLYDLYSMGADGKTKKQLDNKDSVDDIVIARDGGFIGVSADF